MYFLDFHIFRSKMARQKNLAPAAGARRQGPLPALLDSIISDLSGEFTNKVLVVDISK